MDGIDATTGYRRVARVSRTKGLAGALVVAPAIDLPLRTWEDLRLWVVPPEHGLIRETSVRSVVAHGAGLLLTLEGVADRTTAQRLQGRHLLARIADGGGGHGEGGTGDLASGVVPATGAATGVATGTKDVDAYGQEASAVGMEITDEVRGYLGIVVEERRGAAQTLWAVEGPFGEVLIPVVDEFICSRDGQAARVRLPEGLVELNA
jgi:16S rRNA processing protein RimM